MRSWCAQMMMLIAMLVAPPPWSAAGKPASPLPQGTPPVVLISIDTLRADHLSCYGYTRLKTPHIDSLAQTGTLFTDISAQVPITLPSHVSLFTSTYPFANGIRENGQVLAAGAVTLATVLAAHGYRTAAFIGGFSLARRYGLPQGFQTYDSPFDGRAINSALDLKRSAAQVLQPAERWLQHNPAGPFLVFIHLFDLHEPYDPPVGYRARAPQSEYDQELGYVDDSLGSFLQFLRRTGLDRRALIVLFSDHGESLGEHGENTHGYFVYRSTLHVPLIFRWPPEGTVRNRKMEIGNRVPVSRLQVPVANATAMRNRELETVIHGPVSSFQFPVSDFPHRVEGPASLLDVAPTILSFLGISAPSSFCGHSLLDLDNSPARDIYSESFYAHDKFGWAGLRSLRRGDYQYIDAPRPELYDLKHDPGERRNLLPGASSLAASYREGLAALVTRYEKTLPVNGASAGVPSASSEALRALGYLGITASHPALENSGIDPKDRLFEYKRYLLAGHLARTGRAAEAADEFQAILADDPDNLPAAIELGRVDGALHRYLDAANRLKAALALDPHNVEAEELLGDVWLAVGDHERAAAEFRRLLSFAPRDYEAHFGLGFLAANAGHWSDAATEFTAAVAANPLSAEAHYQLGLVREAEHQQHEAGKEFAAALQIDPHYRDARRELAKLSSAGR